jgi:hypothetical protein
MPQCLKGHDVNGTSWATADKRVLAESSSSSPLNSMFVFDICKFLVGAVHPLAPPWLWACA